MNNPKNLFHALAGLALTLIPSYGEIIFSDDFDGDTTNLNGATTDAGAGTWTAASCFDKNGDVNITNANAGSATVAFTPVNGLIYTLEASISLSTGGSGDFVGVGFANGQSAVSGTSHRFQAGNVPEGRAWAYARENTNNPSTRLQGLNDGAAWTGFTTSPSNIDYRIVLDTTGGTGAWTVSWFAKDSANSTYTEIRSATTVTDESFNSVGFCVSGTGVTADISNFTLSDNAAPTPPALVSTDPADDATGVKPDANLIATFNKPIQLGATGDFTIKNLTTATDTVISLPGPDADGTLTVDGSGITIDPAAALGVPGDEIVVEIGAGAIESTDALAYGGLLSTDDPNWSFTIDNIPPSPDYFHPIPGSDKAPLDGALFIAFNEAPVIGTGDLVLHRASDDSIIETFDVASLSVNGNRVTIVPTVPLAYNTSYYVLIDTGAFTDELGNAYELSDTGVWTFSTIANEPEILFGDSFNREDGFDLDASARGKYGSLGAVTYTQRSIGAGSVGNVELSSGQLLLESNENDGTAGALIYPEHNFVDAAIASAGGFSVTVDLNANLSGGNRYMSVALGRATADIDTQTSATAAGSAPTSDLVVALRNNDTLWIYENGTNVTGTGLTGAPATPAKMRIDCVLLTDFTDGATVQYEVFFNDSETAFTSGEFTWSGTDENYISLSSNLLLTSTVGERHALFDNLQIRSLAGASTSAYDTWSEQIADTNLRGRDDDADGDGFTNHQEFLFGATPIAGNGSLVTSTPGSGNLTLRWLQREAGGASYAVEQSGTLETDSWTPVVSPTPALDADQSGAPVDYDYFTVILPTSGGKLFFRIEGEEN